MLEEYKLKFEELAAKKRKELEDALDRGDVADPITATLFTIATLKAVAVSVAVSVASYAVSRAFAPKPPKQTIGKLSGTIQIMNSEQGLMIPEIYGRQIGGIGGIKVPAIIVWTSGIRKIVTITRTPRRGNSISRSGGDVVENVSYAYECRKVQTMIAGTFYSPQPRRSVGRRFRESSNPVRSS